MAGGIQWITVVFIVAADVNLALATLAIVCGPVASTIVHDVHTTAKPGTQVLKAHSVVHAWRTGTLIHVNGTVAGPRCCIGRDFNFAF
jgi:hypothetical protein